MMCDNEGDNFPLTLTIRSCLMVYGASQRFWYGGGGIVRISIKFVLDATSPRISGRTSFIALPDQHFPPMFLKLTRQVLAS